MSEKEKREALHYLLLNRTITLIVGLIAVCNILGWIFDFSFFKNIYSDWATMKPVTAICLLCMALAQYIISLSFIVTNSTAYKNISSCLAFLTCFIGLLSFTHYYLKIDFVSVNDIYASKPYLSPMAPNTAICFVFLSMGHLIFKTSNYFRVLLSQTFIILAMLVSLVALVGYAYNVSELYSVFSYSSMAIHTALGLFFLSLNSFIIRPHQGIVSFLGFDASTKLFAFRQLIIVFLLPVLFGWFRLHAIGGYYKPEFGMALFVVSIITSFTLLIIYGVNKIGKTISKLKEAEHSLQITNLELERKVLERTKEINEEKERFSLAMDAAEISSWEVDLLTGNIIRTKNHFTIFGIDSDLAEDQLDQAISERVHPDDYDLLYSTFENAKQNQIGFEVEFRVVWPDGSVHWLLSKGHSISVDGKLTKIYGVVTPITKLKKIEEILQSRQDALNKVLAENTVYQAALEQSAILAFTDKNGTILSVNDLFCQTSGYTRQELIGKNHRILNSGYHSKEFFEKLWKTISSGQSWRGEICNKSKGGNYYWVDTVIVPQMDNLGNIERYFALRLNITQRKIAEQKLIHSAKMASLGEMAAGVAHEINTPLMAILWNTQLVERLMRDGIDDGRQEQCLENVKEICHEISKIIKGLRSFARDGSSDPLTPTLVKDCLTDTVSLCREKFKNKGITLEVDEVPENLIIECRKVEVSQVILNLLNNSFDAVINQSDPWIKVSIEETEDSIGIGVTDSGEGIPKEIRSNVLKPFFTTKEPNKGTGLGLSISKGLVEAHAGTLTIDESCPNTRFVVSIPKKSKFSGIGL